MPARIAKAVELAMKTPGEPVARGEVGGIATASQLVRLDNRPKPAAKRPARSRTKSLAKPRETPLQKPRKADRTSLDRAEHALDEFHKRATRERAAIARNRKMLELDAEALQTDLDAEEKRLEAAIEGARKRYEAARSN